MFDLDAMVMTNSLAPFQRILLGTDGTVTHMLEAYADEPIRAVKLEQTRGPAGDYAELLHTTPSTEVVRRRVMLRTLETERDLLHAEAVVVIPRIGDSFVKALETTDTPIGALLTEARVETFREILDVGRVPAGPLGALFGVAPADELLYRTYRILSEEEPFLLVTERFPVTWFLDA